MENVHDDAAASGDPTAPASINERGQLDEQQQQQQQQQQEPPQHHHNYHQVDWDQHQHQSRKPIERGVTAEDPGTASPTESRHPSVTTVPGADSDANTPASSAPETTPAEPKLDPAQDTTEPPPQFEPVAVPAIVAPSSYLRPRATTLQRVTMAATPEIIEPPPQPTLADKEQAQGLVGIASPARPVNSAYRSIEIHSRVSQSANELRCHPNVLQTDSPRYGSFDQEKFEHPHPEL